jgi:hypothetical protein
VNHDVPVNTDVPVNPGDTGSTDTSGPLPAATSKVIGPAGGQIVFHNGRLTVTFPRGSLTRPTEVEVSALATPPVGALGTVYVVQPAQEALAVGGGGRPPPHVSVKYGAEIGTAAGTELRLGRFAENHWNDLPGNHINTGTTTVTSELTALGTIGLLSGVCQVCTTTCDPAACTGGGGKCWDYGNGCKKCVPNCDNDGDGFCTGGAVSEPRSDCRDDNINISPDSPEICGNGQDENCDEHIDEGCRTCTTDESCGFGKEACEHGICVVCAAACDATTCRFGAEGMDPGVAGKCYAYSGGGCSRCVPTCDMDGDGYCPEANPGNNQPGGDCNDTNRDVNPGTVEVCGNSLDDDCNGYVDDKCEACSDDAACPRQGFSCVNAACEGCQVACDVTAASCKVPGTADPGADGKCMAYGTGCTRCVPKCDIDGDGFCPNNPTDPLLAGLGNDCDDTKASVFPGGGAREICGNGVDENCNDFVDEGCEACSKDTDCKDGQVCVDGVCDSCPTSCNADTCRFGPDTPPGSGLAGTCFEYGMGCFRCIQTCDKDADGYCPGADAADMSVKGGDCNDMNPAVHLNAPEICGNMIDDDCDSLVDEGCLTCAAGATCGVNESCSTQK